jgi:hypothetical protein
LNARNPVNEGLFSASRLCCCVIVWLQVPSIQQTAALALGRLANYSDDLAEAVVAHEILPQLVYSLGEQNVSPGCATICHV